MSWRSATDETLGLWRRIRSMIDSPDELELLTEINAACAMCDAATETEPKDLTRCERCLAFQQFGGCHEINLEMSVRVAEKDWDSLRNLVDRFIHNLENLEVPLEAPGTRQDSSPLR